jgi:sugar lactone lactonase YvrE
MKKACSSLVRHRSIAIRWFGIMLRVLWIAAALASNASAQDYVVTNDDAYGVSMYSIGARGVLSFAERIPGPGVGIQGGYFGMNRLSILDDGSKQCIFASEALAGDIAWMEFGSGVFEGTATGSPSDAGTSNGIGLAANSTYLYASFTDSSTIATFSIQPGCALRLVSDIAVGGLRGGIIDGMAIRGNMLIATYGDGTIESFNTATGSPVPNGDKQISTASTNGTTYPNGIDITRDGRFALFGDTSTATVVEVSDISAGRLAPTRVYRTHAGISSSNLILSPDETILYIISTQGDVVVAAFFDKATGQLSRGCTSGSLRHYGRSFSYLGGAALQQTTGNGERCLCCRIWCPLQHCFGQFDLERKDLPPGRGTGISGERLLQRRAAFDWKISSAIFLGLAAKIKPVLASCGACASFRGNFIILIVRGTACSRLVGGVGQYLCGGSPPRN